MSAVAACAGCGREAAATARYCRHCGTRLAGGAVSRSPVDACDAVREDGELKQVTILFADVQGSVAIAEQVEAEDWHRLMSGFFAILARSVRRYGGTVSRFTGDGIMALFGAPIAQEDHARRACHAALHSRDALAEYAADVRRAQGLSFTARIGVHSGHVVAARLGSEAGATYTAIGETVGLADCMQRLAEPGSVYVTEETAALVRGFFELRDLGPLALRGMSRLVHAFELRGPGSHRTRLDRARARGFSRFVGRRPELDRLDRALARVVAGNGQVVAVVGNPGTGKSRLCDEFLASARRRGIRTVAWHALAHLASTPFLNFIEDVRHRIGVAPGDSDAAVRDKIGSALRAIDESLLAFLPIVADFLGVAGRDEAAPDRGSRLRDLALLAERFILAASRDRPMVLLVEDLQWLDPATASLLDSFSQAIGSSRLLALLTYRPDHRPAIDAAERIDLGPLVPTDAACLVDDALGRDPSVRELSRRILELTRGNPFFIEEMVWSLADSGVLEGERGAFRLSRPAERPALPATLETTLAARIDGLAPEEKRLLQTAAVLGRAFSGRLLRRAADVAPDRFGPALERLVRAGFLESDAVAGEDRYRFAHPLMQEQAYGLQLAEARRRAHAVAARAIATVDSGKLDERAALVAEHWERAGDRLHAAAWMRRAARWIAPRKVAEALVSWRRVRDLARGLPGPEAAALAIESRVQILELGARVGIGEREGRRTFAEGRALAAEQGDMRSHAALCAAYAQLRGVAGDAQSAVELSERAVELAAQTGDEALLHELRVALVFGYFTAGRFRDACTLAERTLDPWPTRPVPARVRLAQPMDCFLVLFHAMAIVDMGRIDEARRELELVIEAAQRNGAAEILCMAYGFSPVVAQVAGDDPASALARARRAVELAEELESPFSLFLARWGLGLAHLLSGECDVAERVLGTVLAGARQRGVGLQGEAGVLAHLADAALGRGDLDVALARAEEAVAVARRRGTVFFECLALLGAARIRVLTCGVAGLEAADGDLERARTLIRTEQTASLLPVVHVVEALAARARGDEGTAVRELATAQRLFASIGAHGHASRLAELLPQRAAS